MSLPIALHLGGYLWTLLFATIPCVPCISIIMRHLIYWIHLSCLVLNILILHGVLQHSQTLKDAVFHRHRHFFAIRGQSGGITFLNPLLLHMTSSTLYNYLL